MLGSLDIAMDCCNNSYFDCKFLKLFKLPIPLELLTVLYFEMKNLRTFSCGSGQSLIRVFKTKNQNFL